MHKKKSARYQDRVIIVLNDDFTRVLRCPSTLENEIGQLFMHRVGVKLYNMLRSRTKLQPGTFLKELAKKRYYKFGQLKLKLREHVTPGLM